MNFSCIYAFRCAMVRYMYRLDRRYVDTLRDKGYRQIMQGHWKHEMRTLRVQHHKDRLMQKFIK